MAPSYDTLRFLFDLLISVLVVFYIGTPYFIPHVLCPVDIFSHI